MATFSPAVGMHVLAMWGSIPKYYPGVVAEGGKKGFIRINWDDSHTHDDIIASKVKPPRPARGTRREVAAASARSTRSMRSTRKRALPPKCATAMVAKKSSKKAKTKNAKTEPVRCNVDALPESGAKVKVFLEQRGIWCNGEVGRTKGSGRRLMHYVHMLGVSPNDSTHGFYSFRTVKWELLSGSATPPPTKATTELIAAVASAPPPKKGESAAAPVATASKRAAARSSSAAATSGGSTALSRAFNAAMGRLYRRADLHQVLRHWDALVGVQGAEAEHGGGSSDGSSRSSRRRSSSSASGGVARSLLAVPSRDVEAASAALTRVRGLAAR